MNLMKSNKIKGFTLLEIAVVLLIIGLVAGGLLGPLTSQINQRKVDDTQRLLEQSSSALLGYASAKGYLPCPAVLVINGEEGPRNSSGICSNLQGFLPWVTLGTAKSDSWGRLFRYSVASVFANSINKPTLSLSLSPTNTFTIRSASTPSINNLATLVPIVILSHGANGNGATLENGMALGNPSKSNIDEQTNFANSNIFISRVATEKTTAPGGEFDDIVIWIPTSILFNRMVAAGQLP
jgi:prepilin-type N-terminal cleavage/methylation domain-containing protein